jgi:aldehyde:ferredoxin oxidoreductase
MTGYGGRILRVDLGSGRSEIEPLDETTARALLGGNGLAARLLWDVVPAGTDPYDPANGVAVGVGPITDTLVPATAGPASRPSRR